MFEHGIHRVLKLGVAVAQQARIVGIIVFDERPHEPQDIGRVLRLVAIVSHKEAGVGEKTC